jgi:hypothetical protein
MAVYNIPTPNTNAYVRSVDTAGNYTGARAGTGNNAPAATVNGSYIWVGNTKPTSTEYDVIEGFTRYALTSIPSTQQVVSAKILFKVQGSVTGTQWNLEMRDYGTWTTVTGSTYVAGASLSSKTLLAQAYQVVTGSASGISYIGSDTLIQRVSRIGTFSGAATTISTVWDSSRTVSGSTPTSTEKAIFFDTVSFGTDSALIANALPITTLGVVGGASTQLSDGTHIWLDVDNAGTPGTVTLNYATPTNSSTGSIASWSFSESSSTNLGTLPAFQNLALCRDASDNIYVIGRSGGSTNNICIKTLQKTGTLTWSQKTAQVAALPAYSEGSVNNFAAAWHATTGSGHIMLAYSHRAGNRQAGNFGYVTLNAGTLLTGSGTLVSASGPDPSWMGITQLSGYGQYTNDTGSCLDVISNGGNKGVMWTIQANGTTAAGTYTVNNTGTVSAGTTLSTFKNKVYGSTVTLTGDANSKLRLVPIDSARFAMVGKGTVQIRDWNGTLLGSGDVWNQVLGSLSSSDTAYDGITTWDAIYDKATNKIWYYYLSAANQQQLMRTGFSLATYQMTGEEIVVNSAITTSGTNTAIRVSRGTLNERHIKVDVANVNGSTYTTFTTYDSLNVPPNAPTLAAIGTFNATVAKTVSWTFNDANTADSQTAYQLQIQRVSDGVVVYDTAKVASTTSSATIPANTLVNAVAYQWRVKTWDLADSAGSYSAYSAFSTVSAATVTITNPATDGTVIDTDSVAITWTVSGATQAQYRPQITNMDTGVTTDGGYRSSTATTFTWTGLNPSANYQASITIKDSSNVESNPGYRTFSTSFVNPMQPTFTVTVGDTYIELDVTNPDSTGSEPDVDHNDVYRKLTSEPDSSYIRIGSVPYNGTYKDYAVRSGQSYDYKVAGVSV